MTTASRKGDRQCSNNLKQWALAMQLYHDAHKILPMGIARVPRHTWVVSLWPHLEQSGLADSYDPKVGFWQPPNTITSSEAGLMNQKVPVYYCPSDRGGFWRADVYWRTRGNYVVNFGNTRVVGSRQVYGGDPNSPVVDDVRERIPPQYNSASTLTFSATPGSQTKDFDLR